MASGVGVNELCLKEYQALKLKKTYKYIIFTLSKDFTEVVVEKTSASQDYDDFVADLPETECRWAVYDFDFEKEDGGKRNKIIFYSWYVAIPFHRLRPALLLSPLRVLGHLFVAPVVLITMIRSPDDAKIKQKMLFASSKDALRRSLVGIATEIQGTDFSEVAYESVLDKASRIGA
ncbi:actin depolymerizing factor [Lyophyllum atratum]|nr:actin depolymerizing factor [Lyophyllum atratum]